MEHFSCLIERELAVQSGEGSLFFPCAVPCRFRGAAKALLVTIHWRFCVRARAVTKMRSLGRISIRVDFCTLMNLRSLHGWWTKYIVISVLMTVAERQHKTVSLATCFA
jgi:hypothetical protein